MISVTKRDGSKQTFEAGKIRKAILATFDAVGETPPPMGPIVGEIAAGLVDGVSVDTIQDKTEAVLMGRGFSGVAKAYILYRADRNRMRASRMQPDNSMLADYVMFNNYAMYNSKLMRRETYSEMCRRNEEMHVARYPSLEAEIRAVYEQFVLTKRVLPSMRSLQFAGAKIAKHNAAMYNCSFTHLDRVRVWAESMYLLLCGCGVGYSVQFQHVDKLPTVKRVDETLVRHHTIDDSIEGWAEAVYALCRSYLVEGEQVGIEFNYSLIRPEGSLLRTTGGKAPGHLGLKRCLEACRSIFNTAAGRKLRPLEAHDIMCHVADAVVSGGIRRSSMIALFSPEDSEMMFCKTSGVFRHAYGGDPGLNSQRQMANNSVVLLRDDADKSVFLRALETADAGYGDPGFYFTDSLDYGCNPCGEIGLDPVLRYRESEDGTAWAAKDNGWIERSRSLYGETEAWYVGLGKTREAQSVGFSFCNLTEVNGALCSSADDLVAASRAASLLGTLQAGYTDFGWLDQGPDGPVSKSIAERDSLLGVGLMGIMNNVGLLLDRSVLTQAAEAAVAENKRVAALAGLRPAMRVTTVKPSGKSAKVATTASVVVGAGIHAHWSRRWIQGVSVKKSSVGAQYLYSVNPHMFSDKPNGDWFIEFPMQVADDVVTVKDLSAARQVANVINVYTGWVVPGSSPSKDAGIPLRHNVSCTISVHADTDKNMLYEHIWSQRGYIGAMSFVPALLDLKVPYIPMRAVNDAASEARFNELIEKMKPVDWSMCFEDSDTTARSATVACAGGACEIV